MNNEHSSGDTIAWLKTTVFSNPQQRITLQEGEALLRPGQINDRLYLVLEGMLVGHIEDAAGHPFEIFRSGEDNLVGAYSFFSEHHRSYSTVVAAEPTVVAYLTQQDVQDDGARYAQFAARILPTIVEEIYFRQLLAQRMSIENQETERRLHQVEQLATLGQLAAGLAHELNNSMGVILKKAEWLSERITEYVEAHDTRGLTPFFKRGLESGQPSTSAEVRQRRREIEETFDLPPALAKDLAKIGLTDQEMSRFGRDIAGQADQINYYFETGLALHDLLVAARHAGKVVQSVRELGVINRTRPVPTDLNQTVREAVNLLRDLLQGIRLDIQLDPQLPSVSANPSDWVQVWVNIVKNAVEALRSAGTRPPLISIRTQAADDRIQVAITDNGPGIPEELREKIFQPNVTTKVEGLSFGLGLGLSIVQKIVQTYRGTVAVESRPGATTFIIELPQ